MKQPDFFPDLHNPLEPNPMARRHGVMDGKKCKTCKHLLSHKMNKRFYKCAYRGFTHGAATDHRVNWKACTKYEDEK